MIGFILTGHGSFSTGMLGALEMITGPQESLEVVPFFEEESLAVFEEKFEQAVNNLLENCESLVVFSDLLGGTPFRTAMLSAVNHHEVTVITGTNLPTLIEASGLRYAFSNGKELADAVTEVGREGLLRPELTIHEPELTQEEGI